MSQKNEIVKNDQQHKVELLIEEEFSIIELEDRLELANRCNKNCSCPET